ncbi:hypothetical protein BVX99_02940 [bacterium F16]|nr:hypothetical protein BVX99_02940 [bacterium F16]
MTELANTSAQISPLLRYIKEAGKRKRLDLKQQTDDTITAIQDGAENQKKALWDDGLSSLPQQEQEIIDSALKRARIDCDLRVKRKMGNTIDRLLAIAASRLSSFVTSERFVAVLEQLIVDAVTMGESLRQVPDGPLGELKVNPNHEPIAKSVVETHTLNVTLVADATVEDGVIQTISGSKYTVTNTLSSRLNKQENAIRMAIAERLNEALARTD